MNMNNVLLLLLLVLLAGQAQSGERLLGDRALDFTLKSADGENLRLREQLGKVTLLVFWASHCTHCQRQLQALKTLSTRYRELGFQIWAISNDSDPARAIHQADRQALPYRILFDSDRMQARQYRISDIPAAILIDRDGIVRHWFTGFQPSDIDAYEDALLAILK